MRCPKRRNATSTFLPGFVLTRKANYAYGILHLHLFFLHSAPKQHLPTPSLGLMHTTQQNQPHPQIRCQKYLREFPIARWQIRCGVDKESVISCDVIWAGNSSFTVLARVPTAYSDRECVPGWLSTYRTYRAPCQDGIWRSILPSRRGRPELAFQHADCTLFTCKGTHQSAVRGATQPSSPVCRPARHPRIPDISVMQLL